MLRALNIPAGEHEVEMVFDPQSLHTTDMLARAAIILIYVALAGGIAVNVARMVKTRREEAGL